MPPPRKVTAPLNYSTKIDDDTTASECIRLLGKHGARAVAMLFEDGNVAGLTFKIATTRGERSYHLPMRWQGTHKQLQAALAAGLLTRGGGRSSASFATEEQARRVAWRQLKDWLEAQLALIEGGMWELAEVMLPWELVDAETTMYQAVEASRLELTTGR